MSVTLSLLVGLSITRLLTGLVAIFRARLRAELDWVPIAWSIVLLFTLLETWVSLTDLPTKEATFSFGEYVGAWRHDDADLCSGGVASPAG